LAWRGRLSDDAVQTAVAGDEDDLHEDGSHREPPQLWAMNLARKRNDVSDTIDPPRLAGGKA
jgi:hypothetical protein